MNDGRAIRRPDRACRAKAVGYGQDAGPKQSEAHCIRRVALVILTASVLLPAPISAEEASPDFIQIVGDAFEATVRLLGYGIVRDPVEPVLNTNGLALEPVVLGIYTNGLPAPSRYQWEADLRVDVSLRLKRLVLSAKPRVALKYEEWDNGARSGDSKTSADVFLNEWLARCEVIENLFASYARQNLQWGPSYLLSPSNPFDTDNGRNHPKQELPGSDYAQLVWTPDYRWTLSVIANTAEGRRNVTRNVDAPYQQALSGLNDWRDAQAELIDAGYMAAVRRINDSVPWGTGPRYDSLVSQAAKERDAEYARLQEGYSKQFAALDDWRTGTAQEFEPSYALKVDRLMEGRYASLIISRREGSDPRFGFFGSWHAAEAVVLYTEGSVAEGDIEMLVGESYSLPTGGLLALEYFYNESGNRHDPISQCLPPFLPVDPREIFLRRNYLFLQYFDPDIMGSTDVTLRWMINLDDESGSLLGLAEHELADHVQLFATTTINTGDRDTEFGATFKYALTAGVQCIW
ncbi:MAG: hypothetical protein JW951_00090 [Lentisphaerae bacterium]|nr:hypothetical protein [Lentisphaerota bacterium]